MTIDYLHFTPWSSLIGGILIGVAVSVLLIFNGRIAGISGIVGGLLQGARGDIVWRMAFVTGLFIAPFGYGLFAHRPDITIEASIWQIILGGLLVGLGTRYGAGCTSGHGVCGLARLSPRSFIATGTFILAGVVTVTLLLHVF